MDVVGTSRAVASDVAPYGQLCGPLDRADQAIVDLGLRLKRRGYSFTTISPASHARVNRRPHLGALTIEDILGWNRPFSRSDIAPNELLRLTEAGMVERAGDKLKSKIRFSTLGRQLFVHSSFPTEQSDAVFFGPDTYRFARFIESTRDVITRSDCCDSPRILDVGAGSGAGGLYMAERAAQFRPRITLADINRGALRFCRINAALNAVPDVTIVESDLFACLSGRFDLIIANPPYLVDPTARAYRHGGGALGAELSLRIAKEGLSYLAPGGRLVLYTGSAIVKGSDVFRSALLSAVAGRGARVAYEEIDPDVFGEELDHSPYDRVDRLAVVGVTIDVD